MKPSQETNARKVSLLAVVAAAVFAVSGCHEDNMVVNHRTDDNYIRLPGEKSNLKIDPGEIFPLQVGDHWENTVQIKDDRGVEQVSVSGTMVIGGVTGAVLETRQNGKTTRVEIYHADANGDISLLAMGTKDNLLTMSPPIPVLNTLANDGWNMGWSGIIHFRDSSSTASSLSRISGRETISTPAGKFNARRVDTTIVTTINGQTVPLPSRRWLAPGVGMVQSVQIAGNQRVLRQLKSYSVAKK